MEDELVVRAGAGDEAAFEQLVVTYEKRIYNLTLRMTGSRDDAFDLTQETFLKAWHGISLFRFDSSFATWLCRIACNACTDHLRRQRRRRTVSLTELEDESIPYAAAVVSSTQDPAGIAEEKLGREAVCEALGQLPPEFRMVLTLRALEELSYEEIGEALDLKPGTVKSRLARARQRMRLLLSEEPPEGGMRR